MRTTSFIPIVLIGAARSGTRLVRDLVAQHPDVDMVPYDINYIWRYGNEKLPHDELTPDMLDTAMADRIIGAIENHHRTAPFLVEKTVSNGLRIPFVHSVLPHARFIHLIRNPLDVIESAYRQWQAPPDWGYVVRKARTFPILQAFGYASTYAGSALRRFFERDGGTRIWGPRYLGIDRDLGNMHLLEVCACQWATTVKASLRGLADVPDERVFSIRYEDFARSPERSLAEIHRFLGLETPSTANLLLESVTEKNIGRGSKELTGEQRALIQAYLEQDQWTSLSEFLRP